MDDKKFGMSANDRQAAELGAFQGIYQSGNPTALHEALSYCEDKKIPLPYWLTSEIQRILKWHFTGETDDQKGTPLSQLTEYRKHFRNSVRIEAYRTVRRWQSDILRYEDMPTKCIQLWFRGKIGPRPNTKTSAKKIVLQGLEGTYFHCEIDNMNKIAKEYDRFVKDDQASISTRSHDDDPPPFNVDELRNGYMLFQHWPSEIEYGLRKSGQMFGSDETPPPHIQAILDEEKGKKKLFFGPDEG